MLYHQQNDTFNLKSAYHKTIAKFEVGGYKLQHPFPKKVCFYCIFYTDITLIQTFADCIRKVANTLK